jgi:LmbE family N-acetylglucosaminyl deacetylase
MTNFSRVLAIGAHPDDIEYGCLGMLLKMSPQTEKHLFVASMGSAGDPTTGEQRVEESRKALSLVRPETLYFRKKAGIDKKDFEEVLQDIFKLVEKIKPDLILTHGPHDTHQEHRELYEITIAAARRSKATILSYGILSNTLEFRPHYFVDIGEVYSQKKGALREHRSQAQKFYMQDEHLDIFHAHNYASLHGVRFCEAYEIVRMFA